MNNSKDKGGKIRKALCFKCKVMLAKKFVDKLNIGICDKCADKLLVAAILVDVVNNN